MSEAYDDWTSVKSSVSRKTILEADLVLTSVGIETRIDKRLFEWRLMTRFNVASHARLQLDLYFHENRTEVRPLQVLPTLGRGWQGSLVYLVVIWLFFMLDGMNFLGGGRSGALSPSDVQNGEWWLTITAMTLHADLSHIVANSISGAFFGFLASRYLGDGFAWFVILLGGAIGNYLNAWIRFEDVFAIGASTACFAAAGLTAGYVWRKSFIKGASVRMNYLPIAAAVFIFLFMGVSGEGTDVIGHLMGLASGLALGAILGRTNIRRLGRSGQKLSAYAAILLIVTAWSLELEVNPLRLLW